MAFSVCHASLKLKMRYYLEKYYFLKPIIHYQKIKFSVVSVGLLVMLHEYAAFHMPVHFLVMYFYSLECLSNRTDNYFRCHFNYLFCPLEYCFSSFFRMSGKNILVVTYLLTLGHLVPGENQYQKNPLNNWARLFKTNDVVS